MLDTAESVYFNYYWLRDNCPASFDAKTRERSFGTFHLAHISQAEAPRVEANRLVVTWRAGA